MNLIPSHLFYSCKILVHQKFKICLNEFCFLIFFLAIAVLISSCASSKKFTGKDYSFANKEIIASPVRLLINDKYEKISFTAEDPLKIFSDDKIVALVKKGNRINIEEKKGRILLSVSNQTFSSSSFNFSAENLNNIFSFNGKRYRGVIVLGLNKKIINIISLEDYLKGVVPAEMPVGRGTEYFESLKAQAICARTYTLLNLNYDNLDFDLHVDVRDQVYAGVDAEQEISSKAVNETAGMVITYNGEPCSIYYYSTCGGYTEDAENIFSREPVPYLKSIKDGDDPYCKASPRFSWVENYTDKEFISRFVKAGLIPSSDFTINNININSRFPSGRVNELEVIFLSGSGETKSVKIYGNQIRSILRSADNRGILRSILFRIKLDDGVITIDGNGNGHGVGMCQWGAMVQSQRGKNCEDILSHYYPGTVIKTINDN